MQSIAPATDNRPDQHIHSAHTPTRPPPTPPPAPPRPRADTRTNAPPQHLTQPVPSAHPVRPPLPGPLPSPRRVPSHHETPRPLRQSAGTLLQRRGAALRSRPLGRPDRPRGHRRAPALQSRPGRRGRHTPAPVAALRAAVAAADALLLVSPEYAHGVPGVLKNALDWLVSSGECVNKPTAVVTASPSPTGGDHANAQLRETLHMMTGEVVTAACRELPAIGPKIDPATERVADEETLADLGAAMTHLAAAVTAPLAP
ncbi:NADPH-dependent FMN reductase [Streptomyces sioyaensis]|uniref:NADPH-dependent FMN reductase n=1 Tax=Streptomyces sioyaensis TaxID=67364 RepID=UPI001EF0B3CB|nr:NAD(P)H-dependent oxidoreductase [Streptomyces sioyaensis]